MLAGKVAIVTGGNSGIGKAIATRFAAEGAKVVIAARRLDLSRAVAEEIGAEAVRADVTKEPQVRALVKRTMARHGRIDILVNNAGVGLGKRIEDAAAADWERVLSTNLTSAFLCSREVFPVMKRRKRGEIVMMSSVYGVDAAEGSGVYSASKWGMMGMARALLDEGLPHGIRVSCICPGRVREKDDGSDPIPAGEIASLALFLVTLHPNAVIHSVRIDRKGALIG